MSTAVEQIKDKLNIVDVISGYIKVEKAGINWKAKCPFHNEKTPSFFISSARQSFYCFGCGEKGDIFTFVEKFEGLDFKEALKSLADKAGVELKKFRKEDLVEEDAENREKEKMYEILEEATKFFEENLAKHKEAEKYLENRGLTKESVGKWRVGLALDEWRRLHDNLIKKGYSKEELVAAGVIKKAAGAEGTRSIEKYYDTFRDRIMFPISDNNGKVIAFSGRSLVDKEGVPKYLNSPETKLFYKSEVLYGFHIAKNYIRKLDYAVLVEGQMDLVMSHQAHVFNTVASSGTALTLFHLKKIQKLSNRIIVAYDADESGEKAAIRAAELALSLGMDVKIASLEEGEDPASVIKEDPEVWKEALRESKHIIDYALERTLAKTKEKDLPKEIMKSVLLLVSLLKSEMEKSQFVKKIALKIRVTEEAVWNDLKKIEVKTTYNEPERDRDKEREAFIFEVEKYIGEEGTKNPSDDLLKRIELQKLKTKLQENAILLDNLNLSKSEEKKIKTEFEKIQKQIKKLEL